VRGSLQKPQFLQLSTQSGSQKNRGIPGCDFAASDGRGFKGQGTNGDGFVGPCNLMLGAHGSHGAVKGR
jgi:hypothetical protein